MTRPIKATGKPYITVYLFDDEDRRLASLAEQ